jgi:F-type H+-transporting ATPase subunit b
MTSQVALQLLAAAEAGGGSITSVDTTLFWATLVAFGVFAWILAKFAWGPLLKIVDEREKTIRDQVDSAEKAAADEGPRRR